MVSPFKILALTMVAIIISWLSLGEGHFGEVKDATLVDTICKLSDVAPFFEQCLKLLTSDPRGLTSSDPKGMIRVTLELDEEEAFRTILSVEDMARVPGVEDITKIYLLECSDRYIEIAIVIQNALGELGQAIISAQSVKDKALAAGQKALECEGGFNGPPPRGSPITATNENVRLLGIIVAAIFDHLWA